MSTLTRHNHQYIGRFAPSPTGPLHFGSLVTALGSFLDARAANGQWLVRIEDLDPPREIPGATDSILKSLEAHGLHWDQPVIYQSKRLAVYDHILNQWQNADLLYRCSCTRQAVADMGGIYNNHCRRHPVKNPCVAAGWRVKTSDMPLGYSDAEQADIYFDDRCLGPHQEAIAEQVGDFILKRKDGLFAYQLAVVVDDCDANVTHIVRGADLLSSTARQLFLYRLLKCQPPSYAHLPLVLGANGQKLSKQNHAPELLDQQASNNLWQALHFLGQNPPLTMQQATVNELLEWAVHHWNLQQIPKHEAAYYKQATKLRHKGSE